MGGKPRYGPCTSLIPWSFRSGERKALKIFLRRSGNVALYLAERSHERASLSGKFAGENARNPSTARACPESASSKAPGASRAPRSETPRPLIDVLERTFFGAEGRT